MGIQLFALPQGDPLNPLSSYDVLSRYHCIATFGLDGTVLAANATFLSVFEYTSSEVVGRKHRMFLVDPGRPDAAYERMWSDFADGEARTGEVLRRNKSGAVVWLQAVYCPVFDEGGSVTAVMKVATVKRSDLVDKGVNAPLVKLSKRVRDCALPLQGV